MVNLVQLLPMRLLFVMIFGFLPPALTIYDRGVGSITTGEWISFALLAGGSVLVYVVSASSTSIQMQRYLWPLLGVMGVGLLVFRRSMIERGEFDESTIRRGGTSYE